MSDVPIFRGPQDPASLLDLVNGLVRILNAFVEGTCFGELVIPDSAATLTLTTQNTWYKIVSSWVADEARNVIIDAAEGTITLAHAGPFATMATVSFATAASANTLEYAIFRNGTAIQDHLAVTWIDSQTYPNSVSMTGIVVLAASDVLDLRVRCTTAAGIVITPTNANFSVFKIGFLR